MTLSKTKCCQICNSEYSELILANEEMYGYDGIFQYGLCGYCGCLECLNPPENLASFYPVDYYSFNSNKKISILKRLRRGIKRKWILTHPNIISPFMKLWLKSYSTFWIYRSIGLNINHKLLDVGAGSGEHVLELRQAGVKNALGIDLFVQKDIYIKNQILVKKGSLEDLTETFDLIAFHHSLEHMPNQFNELKIASELLNPNGKILVRIPTVSSDVFEKYREKWFGLDAPRHLILHSHASINFLAKKLNLKVDEMWCDSNEMQYIKSEEYMRGVRRQVHKKLEKNKISSIFTNAEIKNFKKMATDANKKMRGDQICILLSRTGEQMAVT